VAKDILVETESAFQREKALWEQQYKEVEKLKEMHREADGNQIILEQKN
jgi:hypothetical protein